jgi:hypothetical protein
VAAAVLVIYEAAPHRAVQRCCLLASSLFDVLDVAYVLLMLYVTTMGQAHAATAAILQHYKSRQAWCGWSAAYAMLHQICS